MTRGRKNNKFLTAFLIVLLQVAAIIGGWGNLAEYVKQIAQLRGVEKPELCIESLDEIIERSKHCKYISKSNLKRLIIERRKEEENNNAGADSL